MNQIKNIGVYKFLPVQKYLKLARKAHYVFRAKNQNPNDKNSVFINYFQIGVINVKTQLLAIIAAKYLNDVAYKYLRSKLNIGYVANAFTDNYQNMLGIVLELTTVKYNFKNLSFIEESIENALRLFLKRIDQIKPHEFRKTVKLMTDERLFNTNFFHNSMITGKILEESQLNQRSEGKLDYKDVLDGLQKELRLEDLIRFVDKHFVIETSRLSIQLFKTAENRLPNKTRNYKLPRKKLFTKSRYAIISNLSGLYRMKRRTNYF